MLDIVLGIIFIILGGSTLTWLFGFTTWPHEVRKYLTNRRTD